jgi:hypothetical protein
MAHGPLQTGELETPDEMAQLLQSRLYRWDCPSPDALGDYHLNIVQPNEREVIEAHLTHCLLCRQEVEALAAFLNRETFAATEALEPETKTSPGQNLWSTLLASVSTIYQGRLQTAGMRGDSSTPVRLTFETGDLPEPVELFLDVEKQLDGYRLEAQLALSERLEALFANALVEIWQTESLVSIVSVDEDNAFHAKLDDLSPLLIRVTTQNRMVLSCHVEL